MYGRYEYTDEKSDKYWEIESRGHGMAVVRWGRIGRIGGEQEITEGQAFDRASQKMGKGYIKVSDHCGPESTHNYSSGPAPKIRQKKKKAPKTTTFEAAMDELAKVK